MQARQKEHLRIPLLRRNAAANSSGEAPAAQTFSSQKRESDDARCTWKSLTGRLRSKGLHLRTILGIFVSKRFQLR